MGFPPYIISFISPNGVFQALVNFSKSLSKFVRSVEILQGDSTAPGCFEQVNLSEGSSSKNVEKNKSTTFKGDVLGGVYMAEVKYENNKFEASGSGCNVTMVEHHYNKGDAAVKEQDIVSANE